MIVQSAPEGQPHFVIIQTDHALMSGQFAAAFGNETFAALTPREPVEYVTAHHDEGWTQIDATARLDAETRLPPNLVKTPLDRIIETGSLSPNFNEAHHPYSGLLSSMHTYGLYHGRYGMSDAIFIDRLSDDLRPAAEAMLAGELDRQERLKETLAEDPEYAEWIGEDKLFHNYKLLQFFDTLALYFNMTHVEARGESEFPNVPRAVGDDVTITIAPTDDGTYRLDPWPFAGSELTATCVGRWISPFPEGEDPDLAAVLAETTTLTDSVTLVAG